MQANSLFFFSWCIFFSPFFCGLGEKQEGGRTVKRSIFFPFLFRPLQLNHPWASDSSPRYSFAFRADHNPISFCPGTSSFSPNVSHMVLLLWARSPPSLSPHYSLLMGVHVDLSTLRNALRHLTFFFSFLGFNLFFCCFLGEVPWNMPQALRNVAL